jgi:hypothetical protein
MSLNLNTTIITTTPYSISNNDDVVFINRPSAVSSVILPSTGTDDSKKRSFYIKDYSGNAAVYPITITAAGGKTIDGGSFAILNGGYAHIQVIYDGTNWKIIS